MLEACHFPELDEPFATALREVVTHALANYEPVLGLIATGSILRGQGDANSDIDLFVLFEGNYRRKVHRHFNGVPCQLFCNPPQRIPRYFVQERGRVDGGNSTAHMLSSGFVVLDRDPRIEQFRQMAREALQEPPNVPESALQSLRYMAADALENVLDLRQRDPQMAQVILGEALPDMLRYYFLRQGHYIPRHKDWLAAIRQTDPELAQLIHTLLAADSDVRFDLLLQIADKTIETRGQFDYTWGDEDV